MVPKRLMVCRAVPSTWTTASRTGRNGSWRIVLTSTRDHLIRGYCRAAVDQSWVLRGRTVSSASVRNASEVSVLATPSGVTVSSWSRRARSSCASRRRASTSPCNSCRSSSISSVCCREASSALTCRSISRVRACLERSISSSSSVRPHPNPLPISTRPAIRKGSVCADSNPIHSALSPSDSAITVPITTVPITKVGSGIGVVHRSRYGVHRSKISSSNP